MRVVKIVVIILLLRLQTHTRQCLLHHRAHRIICHSHRMFHPHPVHWSYCVWLPSYTPTPSPTMASKLLEDMEPVKQKLQCVEKIEKTVNMINVKVTDLETQMKSLDVRINKTEKSCKFISETNESNKKELKNAQDSLSNLRKHCQNLERMHSQ